MWHRATMPYEPPPDLAGLTLTEIAAAYGARRLPPLSQWRPRETGDSGMRIAADGGWWHEGAPITRPAMVRAFASLLTRDEAGRHWLMTPHQKLAIAVEDAAFLAVDCVAKDGALAFRLNTDDIVIADGDHPLTVAGEEVAPRAYVAVRNGCAARLDRATWLQLAEIALAEGDGSFVTSGGVRFALVA